MTAIMFKILKSFNKLTIEPFTANNYQLTTVRWKRKPRWLPTAKSKVFRVPQRPVIPIDETEEIRRLYNNYRTHMKSIKRYLYQRYSLDLIRESDSQQQTIKFEEDFIECNRINNEWNAECKRIRDKRLEETLQQEILKAQEELEAFKRAKEENLKIVDEIVKREKIASATFITAENIDAAIEEALDNEVDYNFAIDLEGNIYKGRETEPKEQKDKAAVKSTV